MILICDVVGLDDTQLHHITTCFDQYELLTVRSDKTDVYNKLFDASIHLESCVLTSNTYTANTKYTSILLIFDNFINDIANINLYLHHIRTDELIFPSRDPAYHCGWVAGHPLAIVKFLSGILELGNFEWTSTAQSGWGNPFPTIETNYTNMFLHWANRIKLKVGALQ